MLLPQAASPIVQRTFLASSESPPSLDLWASDPAPFDVNSPTSASLDENMPSSQVLMPDPSFLGAEDDQEADLQLCPLLTTDPLDGNRTSIIEAMGSPIIDSGSSLAYNSLCELFSEDDSLGFLPFAGSPVGVSSTVMMNGGPHPISQMDGTQMNVMDYNPRECPPISLVSDENREFDDDLSTKATSTPITSPLTVSPTTDCRGQEGNLPDLSGFLKNLPYPSFQDYGGLNMCDYRGDSTQFSIDDLHATTKQAFSELLPTLMTDQVAVQPNHSSYSMSMPSGINSYDGSSPCGLKGLFSDVFPVTPLSSLLDTDVKKNDSSIGATVPLAFSLRLPTGNLGQERNNVDYGIMSTTTQALGMRVAECDQRLQYANSDSIFDCREFDDACRSVNQSVCLPLNLSSRGALIDDPPLVGRSFFRDFSSPNPAPFQDSLRTPALYLEADGFLTERAAGNDGYSMAGPYGVPRVSTDNLFVPLNADGSVYRNGNCQPCGTVFKCIERGCSRSAKHGCKRCEDHLMRLRNKVNKYRKRKRLISSVGASSF